MSWRRFINLLRGLGPNSIWWALLDKAPRYTDPDKAERDFAAW